MRKDDTLWDDTHGVDDLADAASSRVGRRAVRKASSRDTEDASRLIGCPLWWLKAMLPVVHSANELAVALYLYRQRVVQGSRTIKLTNIRLTAELGINRFTKYRTIKKLETARLITVRRRNKKALEITFFKRRPA
jgi:hypothetical protein